MKLTESEFKIYIPHFMAYRFYAKRYKFGRDIYFNKNIKVSTFFKKNTIKTRFRIIILKEMTEAKNPNDLVRFLYIKDIPTNYLRKIDYTFSETDRRFFNGRL